MENFTPVVRFGVMSDTHYSEEHAFVRERFKNAMEFLYAYSEKEEYKNLDALFVVGDFTDLSRTEQFRMFREDCDRYVRKGTKLVVTMANHDLHYTDNDQKPFMDFAEIMQMPYDQHNVLGGYHFISLSTNRGKDGIWHDNFCEAKKQYLREELKKAVADTGNKPIFVFQHPAILRTVYSNFGSFDLIDVLKDYPQVVDFSGHSHMPVVDPREINQRMFTCLSTGSMYNTNDNFFARYLTPHLKTEDYANMLLAEADAEGRVRVKRLDVVALDFFEDDILLEDLHDPSKYKYTESRIETANKPYFEKDAKISAEKSEKGVLLAFDSAKVEGGRVKEYCVRGLDRNGTVIYQRDFVSDYAALHMSPTQSILLPDLPEEVTRFAVYAMGYWDRYSDGIECKL